MNFTQKQFDEAVAAKHLTLGAVHSTRVFQFDKSVQPEATMFTWQVSGAIPREAMDGIAEFLSLRFGGTPMAVPSARTINLTVPNEKVDSVKQLIAADFPERKTATGASL